MIKTAFIDKANQLGKSSQPFLFVIDFEMEKPLLIPLDQAAAAGYRYSVKGQSNAKCSWPKALSQKKFELKPVSEQRYIQAFDLVKQQLLEGNSYLLNLTFPTDLQLNFGLEEIFHLARAPYKLLGKDFVVFSPECFVQIKGNHIYSHPMKGTIDARIPNAEALILQNKKETWEHNTIVDLIRNDLSMVAEQVAVSRFRYLTKIKTHKNELLQVSSEIRGKLPSDWKSHIGEILMKLLPAGSVSGAPKQKTVEIIQAAETQPRGYYTGVFGIFDGHSLDSAVMIRFIEQTANGFRFRSGGGITAMSQAEEEYQELIDKVYVPII